MLPFYGNDNTSDVLEEHLSLTDQLQEIKPCVLPSPLRGLPGSYNTPCTLPTTPTFPGVWQKRLREPKVTPRSRRHNRFHDRVTQTDIKSILVHRIEKGYNMYDRYTFHNDFHRKPLIFLWPIHLRLSSTRVVPSPQFLTTSSSPVEGEWNPKTKENPSPTLWHSDRPWTLLGTLSYPFPVTDVVRIELEYTSRGC